MQEESGGDHIQGQSSDQPPTPAQLHLPRNQPPPSLTGNEHADQNITEKLERDIQSGERWLIGIGILTILVNVGIGFIYYGQLKEMRMATEAATKASDTAANTLTEMRKNEISSDNQFLAQLGKLDASITQTAKLVAATELANANVVASGRPWMGVSASVDPIEIGKPLGYMFTFTNTGQRPAKLTITNSRMATYPSFPANPDGDYDTKTLQGTRFVVPGQNYNIGIKSDMIITPKLMEDIIRQSMTIYIFAKVEYTDVKTEEHYWTHSCIRYRPYTANFGLNGFRSCTEYNDAK